MGTSLTRQHGAKEFKALEEQLEMLKSRGINISNDNKATEGS